MKSFLRDTLGMFVAVLGVALASGCTQPTAESAPDRAEVANRITAKATVVSLEPTDRLMVLRNAEGHTWSVKAGPEVRNFDQIKVGDTVAVNYVESLAVALAKPGTAGTPPSLTVAGGRSGPGEKPAGAIGGQIVATVRIESIDKERNIVVFTPSDGGMRVVHVQRPEGQRFLQGLKPGDQVEITYTEAIAVSVEEQ